MKLSSARLKALESVMNVKVLRKKFHDFGAVDKK